jgi:hypothetical protein
MINNKTDLLTDGESEIAAQKAHISLKKNETKIALREIFQKITKDKFKINETKGRQKIIGRQKISQLLSILAKIVQNRFSS